MQSIPVDSKCVQHLIAGNEVAFKKVYELYSGKIYRLAFKFLNDAAQSEEVVQETFIQLWLNKHKLDPSGNLWLYLFVIAKRLSLNALRQIYKSAEAAEQLLLLTGDSHNHTEEAILGHDLERFTEKILEQLPPQQKIIFHLSRVEGLTHKEIAEQLHISPNTVKNHMVEALKTIKAELRYAELILLLLPYFFK